MQMEEIRADFGQTFEGFRRARAEAEKGRNHLGLSLFYGRERREANQRLELERAWREFHARKLKHAQDLLKCLNPPEPDQIYYYLNLFLLRDRDLSSEVINLLDRVFSCKRQVFLQVFSAQVLTEESLPGYEFLQEAKITLFHQVNLLNSQQLFEEGLARTQQLTEELNEMLLRLVQFFFRAYEED